MYHVALCEDEQIFSDANEKACRSIFEKLSIEYQISVFTSGDEFLDAFERHKNRFDLILLDIVMDGIDGMELARRIRIQDKNSAIIFITSSESYSIQGYDVKALNYLLKPVDTQKLEYLIASAYIQKYDDDVIVIKSGDQYLRVPVKEIVCLETNGRRVEVSLMDRTVYYPGKLTDILKELPSGQFVRCHQSYAVNIKNIRGFNRRSVTAVNGKDIPVSYTYLEEARKAFLLYLDTE